MRKVKKILSLIMASAIALFSVGSPESKGAQTGFNLAVCVGEEPYTIDPALNSSDNGATILNHFFEGLVKWVNNGEGNAMTVPGQADSWIKTINHDGTVTYTIILRDGIKWSDGKAVTASDFEYSWKRLADPAIAADYSYLINMVQGYDEITDGTATPDTLGIKALDNKTLEITLTYDCPYFEEIMALPATFPVRQDIVEGNDDWIYNTMTYIGNGPYKMKEWFHDMYILAEKNENYYDYGNLGPDTIHFSFMNDANAIMTAYKSGELDFIEQFPQNEMANYQTSGELNVAKYIGTYYLCFNTEDEVFSNPLIRKAFSLAIDRNYIVENVNQVGEMPAAGYIPSGINDAAGPGKDDFRKIGGEYYSIAKEDYEKNCEEARTLLARAGYPGGKGFPDVEYIYNTNDKHKAIGEALQNMWQTQLGVTVNLSSQDWTVFLENKKTGNYQIARDGWIADYNDPCSFFDIWYTGNINNDAHYSNINYDLQIDIARVMIDKNERMKAFHAAEDILIKNDSALAPIYFYSCPYMIKSNIHGMYYTPLGYFFFGYTSK